MNKRQVRKPDVFDLMGQKVAKALVETAEVFDAMPETAFQAGAIMALEEFWFRCTGKHLDWDTKKAEILAYRKATSGDK